MVYSQDLVRIVIPLSRPSKGSAGKTGTWRIFTPRIDYKKCTNCFMCWLYCPDEAIEETREGCPEIDYEFCKGCGICAEICPAKAITMERGDK